VRDSIWGVWVCVCVCVCVSLQIYQHIHTYIYICTYMHTYIHAYTHIHIHMQAHTKFDSRISSGNEHRSRAECCNNSVTSLSCWGCGATDRNSHTSAPRSFEIVNLLASWTSRTALLNLLHQITLCTYRSIYLTDFWEVCLLNVLY